MFMSSTRAEKEGNKDLGCQDKEELYDVGHRTRLIVFGTQTSPSLFRYSDLVKYVIEKMR